MVFCWRDYITEDELDVVLPIFLQNRPALLQHYAEVLPALQQNIERLNFDSFEHSLQSFSDIGRLFSYTTESQVVENYIRNANLYLQNLDTLVSCKSYRSELLIAFTNEILRHVRAKTVLGNDEGVLSFTEGYELREFLMRLYERVEDFNLEQALRMLESYYELVVVPALKIQKIDVEHHEA